MTEAESAALVDLVMAAAEQDEGLDDESRLLLLSALSGDDDLQAEIVGRRGPGKSAGPPTTADREAAGAFLKSISVAGFRGIGPEARLNLLPAPGLVIVAGRNGSGKSTFSEAVETALTRSSYRWRNKRTKDWQAGWRNLHVPDPCRIRVELAEEGAGRTVVGADWDAGSDLDGGSFWVQRRGEPRDYAEDPLGWNGPIELYRPLLSYDELGGILEAGPSQLHDALSKVLGLGLIADAQARLDGLAREAGAPRREARSLIERVGVALEESGDTWAAKARELLAARPPDLSALDALATGAAGEQGDGMAPLRQLAELSLPGAEAVEEAVVSCERVAHHLLGLSGAAEATLERRRRLLVHALEHVEADAVKRCPLCGVGTLDDEWVSTTRDEVESLASQTTALRQGRQRYDESFRRLRALVPAVPPVLRSGAAPDVSGLPAAAAAWHGLGEVDVRAGDGLRRYRAAFAELEAAVETVRREAGEQLRQRQDLWAPLARLLVEVSAALRRADEADQRGATAKQVATWLKKHANELRNERLRPISDQARQIWAELRQESNVDLGPIELAGSGNRRRAVLAARVDDEDAGALAVMSQGELHALALALFLPRASFPASPFRFVIVDDPVQAMDPAKVDGLARMLDRIGKSRQVVVFTHDDRLPEAVRRLGLGARILHVERREGSRVEVMTGSDPALRYLSDADAVAKDPNALPEVRRRVIPVLCRMAVESASRDLFMARRYGRGESRVATEEAWEGATTTRRRLALALRDDAGADVGSWMSSDNRRRAAMRLVGSEAHDGLDRDPVGAVRDVGALVRAMREAAR